MLEFSNLRTLKHPLIKDLRTDQSSTSRRWRGQLWSILNANSAYLRDADCYLVMLASANQTIVIVTYSLQGSVNIQLRRIGEVGFLQKIYRKSKYTSRKTCKTIKVL